MEHPAVKLHVFIERGHSVQKRRHKQLKSVHVKQLFGELEMWAL